MNCGNPMEIWRFKDAPEHLKSLSQHGGDEDYLAVAPKEYEDDFLLQCSSFGCYDISKHIHPEKEGYFVYIGAHA